MMLKKLPGLFKYKVDTNLKPKMEYFKSLGFTDEDIAKILAWEPYILERSMEKQIIPSIQVLRRVLGTDLDMLRAIKACYYILEYDLEDTLERNILALKSHGVPETLIPRIFIIQPRTLLLRHYQFEEVLEEVAKFGFNLNNILVVLAVCSIATMSRTLWKQKLECYRSFGLSTDQVYAAFKLQPMFMLVSEKKIEKWIDFFTRRLKLEPSIVSRNPGLLLCSLEKRIIPRSSVLQLLMSKGFVKRDTSIIPYIRMTERNFTKNIVLVHRERLPDVVKAHEGNIEFQGFPVILKTKCV